MTTRYPLTGLMFAAAALVATGASAQEPLLSVDWSSQEIKAFVEQRKADVARGAAPAEASRLDKLKLPVIGFQGAPATVQSSFPGLGPQPTGERQVITDDANPVWYQIVDTYGDVTVSVAADLRVQHAFGDSYPVYSTTPPGAAPTAGPQVSVFDATAEEGMEGAIAEYTITRFGIPYTVTIECTAATKARCADTQQIAKDADLLKLLAATPPR
ncbi:MAG: hypothetical protein NW216_08145 [Hyphomicrobium sp.]|nr:hypothetical protein [Hyphomicrobium sp.]